jgi:hypothetical protein
MNTDQFETFLANVLKRRSETPEADQAAAERILKRLSGPLPKQKTPFWRLPEVLLDWQFAPAWPRVAALACCAILGFMFGIAGIDRGADLRNAPFVISNSGDLGSVVFEPEPMTGAPP